ncbi:hypothetical protein ESCOCK392M_24885 [Escherichia coli]|nr:hypothetical protein G929_01514 [Escherichia coli UMEA 3174-1]
MLPSETMIWQPEFTDKTLSRKPGAVQASRTPAMPEGGDNADDVMNVTDPISGITFQIALYRQYRQVRYEVGLAWGVSSVKPAHGCLILG